MWEQIRSNRIRSAVLIAFMGALLLALGYVLGLYFFEDPIAGLVIATVVWLFMNLIAYFQGDSILLSVARARKIGRDDFPRLYNIVEEMKIASGLAKMPDIYIIDDPAPNAFAVGRSPEKASVAVTSGLLQRLNRDELQGVIAHEMAHINNRDVLLMSLAGVILGTVVILAWYASRMMFFGGMSGGRRSSRSSGGGSGGGQAQIIILVVGLVLMILAPIAAQLLYFAISRKREYLADASGALYTRYPEGLASALEKIAATPQQLKTANQATAPMYIINPFRHEGRAATDLSSTHPPISERVRILRAMAGISPADYERAYEKVKGKKGIIPASALNSTETAVIRPPSAETGDDAGAKVQRTREASDVMWRMGSYKTIDCECGTKLRVPPSLKSGSVQCPHCGRLHNI
ncbi:MAG: M48 family metallopeptidase [Dehalococcoidales bacterium]|nr:M48 family metallopeptidase [Dehalococcoidales bacterium]